MAKFYFQKVYKKSMISKIKYAKTNLKTLTFSLYRVDHFIFKKFAAGSFLLIMKNK